jgi:hypothetical protein
MRTFLMLPLREKVGEPPLKPGFWMPRPSTAFGRGFFRLDRSGLLVEPFVEIVATEPTLPVTVLIVVVGEPEKNKFKI